MWIAILTKWATMKKENVIKFGDVWRLQMGKDESNGTRTTLLLLNCSVG